jgi:hypothetical protein
MYLIVAKVSDLSGADRTQLGGCHRSNVTAVDRLKLIRIQVVQFSAVIART